MRPGGWDDPAMATTDERPRHDVLEQEPQQIADHAAEMGEERLDRSRLDILLTALIGGVEVSLGGIAAMTEESRYEVG